MRHDDFVILGRASDPARIRGERSAAGALRKIAAAGVAPGGAWYVKAERGAAGNAATTRDADARQAYVLMDRATYLTLKREISLQVLVERG